MRISKFGRKITGTSGIGQLMDDLAIALSGGRDMLMLGGGNPAHIQHVQKIYPRGGARWLGGKRKKGVPNAAESLIAFVCFDALGNGFSQRMTVNGVRYILTTILRCNAIYLFHSLQFGASD